MDGNFMLTELCEILVDDVRTDVGETLGDVNCEIRRGDIRDDLILDRHRSRQPCNQ